MTYHVAINGFGRIGRLVLRALIESKRTDMKVVAINDLADASTLAHLLKYDSVHGRFPGEVHAVDDKIIVNGHEISVSGERSPKDLPWKLHKIDIVMECTGFFLTQELCDGHLSAGAKCVLISAPAKGDVKTIVYGVNHDIISPTDRIISNASCTTNALAPIIKTVHDAYGVRSGLMTTIHAYTGDQPTHDSVHKDKYRGRAAALSMIPTSTGAASAISKVIPELAGRLDGVALRVPVANVSAIDVTIITKKPVVVEQVRELFLEASKSSMKNIIGYVDEQLVSSDFNHDPYSCNFVEDQVFVQDKTLLRLFAWYDNEWGFSNRMIDTASVLLGEVTYNS